MTGWTRFVQHRWLTALCKAGLIEVQKRPHKKSTPRRFIRVKIDLLRELAEEDWRVRYHD